MSNGIHQSRQRRILLPVLGVVIMICLVSLFRGCGGRETTGLPDTLAAKAGSVLAQETASLLGETGHVVILLDDGPRGKTEACRDQVASFLNRLSGYKQIRVVSKVNVPPQADPGPRQLPGDTYLDMLTKHADAAAIVSFVGEPRFEAADAPSLPEERPRFICVSMADVLVRPLIQAGYVDLALAARLKPDFGATDDSESERDFVLRFYEILQR